MAMSRVGRVDLAPGGSTAAAPARSELKSSTDAELSPPTRARREGERCRRCTGARPRALWCLHGREVPSPDARGGANRSCRRAAPSRPSGSSPPASARSSTTGATPRPRSSGPKTQPRSCPASNAPRQSWSLYKALVQQRVFRRHSYV